MDAVITKGVGAGTGTGACTTGQHGTAVRRRCKTVPLVTQRMGREVGEVCREEIGVGKLRFGRAKILELTGQGFQGTGPYRFPPWLF